MTLVTFKKHRQNTAPPDELCAAICLSLVRVFSYNKLNSPSTIIDTFLYFLTDQFWQKGMEIMPAFFRRSLINLWIIFGVILSLALWAGPSQARSLTGPSQVQPAFTLPKAGNWAQIDNCTPENKYQSAEKVPGFNGLALEYAVEGMPISEFVDWRRTISGYPSGKQVTINFKMSGPYSIEGNWATSATVSVNGKQIEYVRAPDQGGAPGWTYTAKPVVIDITDDVRRNGFVVLGTVLYSRSSNAEGVSVTVKGLPCSQPAPADNPPLLPPIFAPPAGELPTDGQNPIQLPKFPWGLAVGIGLGVVAVAAAAIAAAARTLTNRTPPPNEQVGYVLQLSANEVTLNLKQPMMIQAAAWQVTADASYLPAPEALLQVVVPPNTPYLQVTPLNGQGQMQFWLTLVDIPPVPQIQLQINAQASRGGTSANLVITFKTEFRALVEGKTMAQVRFDETKKAWGFPDVLAGFWFGTPGTPVQPGFKYGFPEPPFIAKPDVLQLEKSYTAPDGLTYGFQFKLKSGLDLENYFGEDLYSRYGGQIKLTMLAKDENGDTHQAHIIYQLTPQIKLSAHGIGESYYPPSGHTHPNGDLELAPFEFVADSQDGTEFVAYFYRTDRPQPGGSPFKTRVNLGNITQANLKGSFTNDFDFEQDTDLEEGLFQFKVKSKQALLLTEKRTGQPLNLQVDCALGENAPKTYELLSPQVSLPLKPQYPYIKLWVTPGKKPGTSQAVAYTFLGANKERAFSGLPLRLKVESNGPASLNCDNTSAVNSDESGLVHWTLTYKDLTWSNYDSACWQVKCGIPDSTGAVNEAVQTTIDINKNVNGLLEAIFKGRRSKELDLENPVTDSSDFNWFYTTLLEKAWPDFLTGPMINIVVWISEKLDSTRRRMAFLLDEYTCHSLSERIYRFAQARRFGGNGIVDPDDLACMNGIEIQQYKMYFLGPMTHHFMGIYLSGSGLDDDPRFIDPWWRQDWSSPDYCRPQGLITKSGERLRGAGTVSSVALLAIGTAKVLVALLAAEASALTIKQMVKLWFGSHILVLPDLFVSADADQKNLIDGEYQNSSGPRDPGYRIGWEQEALSHYINEQPNPKPLHTVVW
jgi:hypothetical protein